MIGGLGVGELVIILVIVLLIFGPNKLGDVGSAIGSGISGFKKAMQDKEQLIEFTFNSENAHVSKKNELVRKLIKISKITTD